MAQIVLGIGTSHSPQVSALVEGWTESASQAAVAELSRTFARWLSAGPAAS
jgi:hypothetical protein